MSHIRRLSTLVTLTFLVARAAPAFAADKCSLKAVLGGKNVTMTHCAIALYDDAHSVTVFFSDTALTPKEVEAFQLNSSPQETDAAGKPRTLLSFAFCPGGGAPAPKAAAVARVMTTVDVAGAPLLGRQWGFDLPNDKALVKIEKVSGDLKPGGRLAGRITGGKLSDGLKYSWEADFDLALQKKSALAGLGCGK